MKYLLSIDSIHCNYTPMMGLNYRITTRCIAFCSILIIILATLVENCHAGYGRQGVGKCFVIFIDVSIVTEKWPSPIKQCRSRQCWNPGSFFNINYNIIGPYTHPILQNTAFKKVKEIIFNIWSKDKMQIPWGLGNNTMHKSVEHKIITFNI